jgi:hypothetical protein
MRDIHDDAERVATTHDVRAEIGETVMHARSSRPSRKSPPSDAMITCGVRGSADASIAASVTTTNACSLFA